MITESGDHGIRNGWLGIAAFAGARAGCSGSSRSPLLVDLGASWTVGLCPHADRRCRSQGKIYRQAQCEDSASGGAEMLA